ncbi:hypothetical protein ABFX02_12G156700 [Erythranthe guttata]
MNTIEFKYRYSSVKHEALVLYRQDIFYLHSFHGRAKMLAFTRTWNLTQCPENEISSTKQHKSYKNDLVIDHFRHLVGFFFHL